MGVVPGSPEGRVSIVWYEGESPISLNSLLTTTNSVVVYKYDLNGEPLSYRPEVTDNLQGFLELIKGGYIFVALQDIEIPNIIEQDAVNVITGLLILGDYDGSGQADETQSVNTLTGNINLNNYDGVVNGEELTEAVTKIEGGIILAIYDGSAVGDETLTEISTVTVPYPSYTGFYDLANNQGEIKVKGTASITTTAVEAKWGSLDWQLLDDFTISNGDFRGYLRNIPPGRNDLQVRALGQSSSPTSITDVGCGIRILIQSQSGGSGRGAAPYDTYNDDGTGLAAYNYTDNGDWVALVDPVDDATGTTNIDNIERDFNAGGSWWVEAINHWMRTVRVLWNGQLYPVPASLIVGSAGDTALLQWQHDYISPNGVSLAGDRFTVTDSSQNLYNKLLTASRNAYSIDNDEELTVSFIAAHFGAAEIYGDPPRETYNNIPLFNTRAEAIVAQNLIEYNAPTLLGILQNCDGAEYNETFNGEVKQVIIRNAQIALIVTNENVFRGGDLSQIGTDDGVHIIDSTKNTQAGLRWGESFVLWYNTQFNNNIITGNISIGDYSGNVVGTETESEGNISGNIALGGYSGTAALSELDTLKPKFVHFWELNESSGQTRIDSVGGVNLIDSSSNVPTSTFIGGINEHIGADFGQNHATATGFLISASAIDLSNKSFTIVITCEINNNTDDMNFFNQWDESLGGTVSIDRRPSYTPSTNPSGAGFRMTLSGSAGISDTIVDLTGHPAGVYLIIAQYNVGNGTTAIYINDAVSPNATGTLTGGVNQLPTVSQRVGQWNLFGSQRRVNGIIGFIGVVFDILTADDRALLWNDGNLYTAFAQRNDVTGAITLGEYSGSANGSETSPPGLITGSIQLNQYSGVVAGIEVPEPDSSLVQGLLASWALTADTTDASGNNYTLTEEYRNGDTPFTYSSDGVSYVGKNGSHLSLNGLTNSNEFIGGNEFSISFVTRISSYVNMNWVKWWDFENLIDSIPVFTVDYSTGSGGRIRAFISNTTTTTIAQANVPLNQFFLLVLTYSANDGVARMYLRSAGGNWVQDNENYNQNLGITASPLVLGSWQPESSSSSQWRNPTGTTKFFHFWNRVIPNDLTADSELDQLYNGGNFLTYPFNIS